MNNLNLTNKPKSLRSNWENHNQFVWGLVNDQIKKHFNK